MMKHLFIHGMRVFKRQKFHCFLNITGLSIGIATSLFIALYIYNELSYDNFHENKDRIYRLILDGKVGEQEVLTASSSSPVGPYMMNEFPEVEQFCRMNSRGKTVLKYNEKIFTEDKLVEVDSSFFRIFSLQLLRGEESNVLNKPHTLVLSESTAKKIFGDSDAMNKLLMIGTDPTPFTVTGIMEDVPANSHFEANVLASFMTNRRADDNNWLMNSFTTYLLLKPGASPSELEEKLPEMIRRNVSTFLTQYFGMNVDEFIAGGNRYSMYLQELSNIHLNPDIEHQQKSPADPKYLYIFGSVALLIIIIASINFTNLSIAQASRRAQEVGIKKVCGSSRKMLILQFLFESVLLTFISLLIAMIFIWLLIPYISQLINREIVLSGISPWKAVPYLVLFSLILGVVAGSYPAFYLSSFSPVRVLKSGMVSGKRNVRLRSILVVFQFSISIVLIIGTLVMYRQINFMLNKDLGFNKERVLVISRAEALGDKVESFHNELMSIPDILKVSASTAVPGRNNNTNGYTIEGRDGESFLLETNWVDLDFFDTYDISLGRGRYFNFRFQSDKDAVVINQTAMKQFQLDPVLGTRFINHDSDDERFLPVIGVVNDFHFKSLHSGIAPYIFRFKGEDMNWGFVSVKLGKNFTNETIKRIETLWKGFTSDAPLQYFFLDNDFERKYQAEKQNASLSVLFSLLAIFIASLGLFGLTSFSLEARTKEIGIRKTLGAGFFQIFYMVSKEIAFLVLIAAFISFPVIYSLGKHWLNNYYYRIDIGFLSFLIGFLLALVIAILTISYKTSKTFMKNPSHSLRYE